MMNFLSLKEMFLISLQGKPILGVSLKEKAQENKCEIYGYNVVVHWDTIIIIFWYSVTFLHASTEIDNGANTVF